MGLLEATERNVDNGQWTMEAMASVRWSEVDTDTVLKMLHKRPRDVAEGGRSALGHHTTCKSGVL